MENMRLKKVFGTCCFDCTVVLMNALLNDVNIVPGYQLAAVLTTAAVVVY